MKGDVKELFGSELRWWRSLCMRHRLYVAYFLVSFSLVCMLAEANPVWVLLCAVLNLGNSVRLLKRVPCDGLDE